MADIRARLRERGASIVGPLDDLGDQLSIYAKTIQSIPYTLSNYPK